MKRKLLILLIADVLGLFAQAPFVIYYAVDQMRTETYLSQSTGSVGFELLFTDNSSGSKQTFCYTWGCMRCIESNTVKMSTVVDNGYFYDYNSSNQTSTQTTTQAAGRYVNPSPNRSMELSLKTYAAGNLACTEPQAMNFYSDLPQYLDLKYTSACTQNTGVSYFNGYFKGTMAMVSEGNTYPYISKSTYVDPLNITSSTITLWAPDFMANYFSSTDITWYKDGTDLNITGKSLTIGVVGTQGNGAQIEQKCEPHTYTAVIKKFNWFSSGFKINFFPNLRLGTDVIVFQPVCNEVQGKNDSVKTESHITLGAPVIDRFFYVNVYDINNSITGFNLSKLPNDKFFNTENSPYKLKIVEKFPNNIVGCPQTFSNITITAPKAISLKDSTFNDILCFGDRPSIALNIDGNTTNYMLSYGDSSKSLQKGQAQNILLMKGSNTYNFSISDDNGCVYEKPLSYKATEPAKLEASLSITNALCFDQNATVLLSAKGGTAFSPENPYRYTFTSNASAQTEPLSQIKAGTLIQPKVLDKNNCFVLFKDSMLYNPADFKLQVVQQKNNACPKGANASIQLSGSSTDKLYHYTYAKDAKTYRADSLFASLPSGTSTFQVQNQFGCLRDTTVTFTEPPYISISKTAVDSVRCVGESNGSITISVTGGTGFKKLWKGKGTAYLPPNKPYTFSYAYDSLPDQNYWFHAQDSLGCRDSVVYNIGTRSTIQHLLTAFAPSCDESKDGQLRVSNTGGIGAYQNEWLAPQGLDKHLVQTGLPKGTYILKSSDALACIKIDTFILTAPAALKVDLQGYPLICKGQSIDLDAGIVVPKYEWTSTKGFMANTKVVRLYDAGTYMLKVTDGLGCTGRDTFVLKQSDTEFKADFWVATTVVQGDTVVLVNNNAEIDNLVWVLNPSNTERLPQLPDFRLQEVVFLEKGEQEVQMTGYYKGCRDILKKKILVVDPSERLKYDQAIGIKTSIIKTCGLFPNPNDGSFSLHLELNEANVPVALLLSSTTTGSLLKKLDWKIYPEGKIDFTEDLPEGPYVLHVKVRDEVVALRFLVAYD